MNDGKVKGRKNDGEYKCSRGARKRGWGSGRGGLTKLMYHTLDHPIFGFWLDLFTPTLQLYFSYIYIYI